MTALNRIADISGKDYILILFILLLFISGCNTSPGTKNEESKAVSAAVSSTEVIKELRKPAIAGDLPVDSIQSMLKGKWIRSDGTYTIEIFSINDGGKMDAGYFNPNPINVGSSTWMISEGSIVLEIVMRDANYPGSKYNLIYDRQNDLIMGNYFQAVQGINYDVMFTRKKQ